VRMRVLDASVVLKWFVEEEGSHKAEALLDEHVRGAARVVVPDLLVYEAANALRFSGGFEAREAEKIIDALWALDLYIVAPQPDVMRSALALSFFRGISVYDSVYVALAKELGLPLITADKKLLSRLQGLKFVFDLGRLDLDPISRR